ncbi:Ribose-5-phosphate isomerase A (Phosphoriboisomerase A) (PRI) (fragment) [Bradyrhizobium sp. STM 3843]
MSISAAHGKSAPVVNDTGPGVFPAMNGVLDEL